MEKKGFKVVGELLTKTVGLVFFSLLAIGLGVLFGVLFEGMLRNNPEDTTAIVQTDDSTIETTPYTPAQTNPGAKQPAATTTTAPVQNSPSTASAVAVINKVMVGPFASYDEAAQAAEKLKGQGYPTYILSKAPYAVQVGAFSSEANAENLRAELASKGFKSFVKKD